MTPTTPERACACFVVTVVEKFWTSPAVVCTERPRVATVPPSGT
ncbi:hypothetical protein [Mumia sp. zg.B17]|nr:hypothetical protein [Mumia sp. zg.B17]